MTLKSSILLSFTAMTLLACSGADRAKQTQTQQAQAQETQIDASQSEAAEAVQSAALSLDDVLEMQDSDNQARYVYRNPKATMEFFGIKPGMTVLEALPGGGWYSKILLPYLGDDGHLIGVDYSVNMWSEFGGFATDEFLEKKKTWPQEWSEKARGWRAGNSAQVSAFTFGDMGETLNGTADAALFIRALHNLSRFEDKGYMSAAMQDVHRALKPGGIVGIVQHKAPEANSDAATKGSNGYLKQSTVIAQMQALGFEFVAASDINANPKDVPSNDDIVWRLPPALSGSDDNAELRTQMQEIGESNRMTLLFKKA